MSVPVPINLSPQTQTLSLGAWLARYQAQPFEWVTDGVKDASVRGF
jgi:hypothetical protein